MRAFYLVIITILMMSYTQAQSNPFQLNKDHDAIEVKDVDASARFYSEILRLKEIPNGGLDDHIRWFELDDQRQIHLIESKDLPETQKGVHMALSTNRLSEIMDFLKSKKVHFENWSGKANTTNTRPDGIKQIYLQDPDGYWIEINDNSF